MLVITRRAGEAILIGQDIKILVKHVQGGAVKLGIAAPSNVDIMRNELIPITTKEVENNDGHEHNDQ